VKQARLLIHRKFVTKGICMLKLAILALLAFGIAINVSSTSSASLSSANSVAATTESASTASLIDSMAPPKIWDSDSDLSVTAAATRCYCADGWSFLLNPCSPTRCSNLCVHGHSAPGFCE
jgi:hypothetical protein